MTTFAERLRYAMAKAEINQAVLSERSGIPRPSISQYLAGKNIPSRQRIAALSKATGVKTAFLNDDELDEEINEIPTKKISVTKAARCMGMSPRILMNCLENGTYTFGKKIHETANKRTFNINPYQFRKYIGTARFNEFFGIKEVENC